jgi:hypothetical protein
MTFSVSQALKASYTSEKLALNQHLKLSHLLSKRLQSSKQSSSPKRSNQDVR